MKTTALKNASTTDAAELAVVFCALILPAIVSGLSPRAGLAEHSQLYSGVGFLKELIGSLKFGLLAALLLTRNPFDRAFCTLWPKGSKTKQLLAGVGLWIAYYVFFDFWSLLANAWRLSVHSTGWMQPLSAHESGLNLLFSVVNGLSEEIFRLYLLSQLLKLGAGWRGTTVGTAALIASYHVYQGPFIAVGFFAANVAINRAYAANRSLPMLFVWHALSDYTHSTSLPGLEIVSAVVSAGFMSALSWIHLVRL